MDDTAQWIHRKLLNIMSLMLIFLSIKKVLLNGGRIY